MAPEAIEPAVAAGTVNMDWPFTLRLVAAQKPCVLVTLNLIGGSSPRESGCRMIVTHEDIHGSIGGGNLEYTAIARARELLAESLQARQQHEAYGLGPDMNQCCGGAVRLLFEVISGACPGWVEATAAAWEEGEPFVLAQAIDADQPLRSVVPFRGPGDPPVPPPVREAAGRLLEQEPTPAAQRELGSVEADGLTWWLERLEPRRWPLYLFGAGHVGQEVARLLERLPFDVHWVDGRPGVFPPGVGSRVRTIETADPDAVVAAAEPRAIYVVMTHSHALDEDVCHAILQRDDFCWLGLIGSVTKRRRFEQRLAKRGVAVERLQRMVCPIGLRGIRGKQPATIALSIAAQLMEERPWIDAKP